MNFDTSTSFQQWTNEASKHGKEEQKLKVWGRGCWDLSHIHFPETIKLFSFLKIIDWHPKLKLCGWRYFILWKLYYSHILYWISFFFSVKMILSGQDICLQLGLNLWYLWRFSISTTLFNLVWCRAFGNVSWHFPFLFHILLRVSIEKFSL